MFLKLYLTGFVTFLLIDMIWLGVVARQFYAKHLGFIMSPTVNWVAAIVFYLLFILGIVFFVVTPSLSSSSWVKPLLSGALFGLVTYATYDLTNLATLKNWPLIVTLVDLAWGSTLSALIAVITHQIALKYF